MGIDAAETLARPSTLWATLGLKHRTSRGAAVATVVLVLAWAVFVPEGSQPVYLIALVAAATAAALFGWARSWLAVLFVVAIAVLIGTEARGELGRGNALLGSLRLLDVCLLAAAAGLVARAMVEHRSSGAFRGLDIGKRPRWSPATWILVAITAWMAVGWLAHGADTNALVRTDVRLLLLAFGMLVVARTVLPGHANELTLGLLMLTPVLAVKAALIYFTGAFAVGSFDRLQASAGDYGPIHRVLLVGGDTLFILAPAVAIAFAMRELSPATRWLCALAGASAAAGLLLSGTRTGLLVAMMLVLAALVISRGRRLRASSSRAVAVAIISLLLVGLGAAATGMAQRLVGGDKAHTGLNFRGDEIRSATELPTRDLLVGQGLGGSFISKDVNGQPVRAAWSHVLPVWIVLKVGLVGLAALLVALALFARRCASIRRARPEGPALVGILLLGGLIVMSLTINRLGQPEGALLAAVGVVLISQWASRKQVACA